MLSENSVPRLFKTAESADKPIQFGFTHLSQMTKTGSEGMNEGGCEDLALCDVAGAKITMTDSERGTQYRIRSTSLSIQRFVHNNYTGTSHSSIE